jgi:hypothetical protein
MGSFRQVALPLMVVALLAAGCGGATGPASNIPAGPDTPVSDTPGSGGPGADRGGGGATASAGRGTAVITVRDPGGEPLALIPVQVATTGGRPMPEELAIEIARMTDARGEYTWTNIPPGAYEFTVRVPGGDKTASKPATVTAGRSVRVDLTLG